MKIFEIPRFWSKLYKISTLDKIFENERFWSHFAKISSLGIDVFKKNVDFNQDFSRILTKIEIFGNLDQNRDVSNKIEIFRRF